MKAARLRSLIPLATLLLLAGCHRDRIAMADHPRSFAGVAVGDISFYSSALERKTVYRVYLPKEVAPGVRLPAVYLLHGCDGSFRDWSDDSDVGAYASKGLILVMVDGACSYYINAALIGRDRYEDYFVRDVLADVASRFPVRTDRAGRAVVGVSMGGFAAIELALTRPELFVFAGAISPAVDVPGRRFSVRRWQQSLRFLSIFGRAGSEARRQRDPFVLVGSADPAKTPYFYITAGTEEPLLAPIRRFTTLLGQRHYGYEFHTLPGGHDWGEWSKQVPGCFESLLIHLHKQQGSASAQTHTTRKRK